MADADLLDISKKQFYSHYMFKRTSTKSGKLILFVIASLGFIPDGMAEPDAASDEARPLYIIFDGSNSMWGELADKSRKIEAAKIVFKQLDPSLFKGREVALRLYGHRRKADCKDTELAVPLTASSSAVSNIAKIVARVSPKGKTPITLSLQKALKDFSGKSGDILLISDGIETCGVDPCELVQSWADQDIDIRVHVVGLGLTKRSRNAMQCIADASGTQYLDANTIDELSSAIETTAKSSPPVASQVDPANQERGPEFKISAVDKDGNYLPVKGTISNADGQQSISSNQRHVIAGGKYQVEVGVPTVSGELFSPITQQIDVKDTGTTRLVVTLPRPALIRSRFMEKGKETRGTIAAAYQNEVQVFKLRAGEDYYVMPGSYNFQADLNKDNSKLSMSAMLVAGDDRDIVFNVVETVRTYIKVMAQGQTSKLRQHQQLWQNDELKYKIHHANGADVQPGTYTLKSESTLTPYEIQNVVIPAKEKQTLTFTIPSGKARLEYKFIQEPSRKGRRCWLYRLDNEGNDLGRSSGLRCDGSEVVLVEGHYRVHAWSYLGTFEETRFQVKNSELTTVDVQQIEPL